MFLEDLWKFKSDISFLGLQLGYTKHMFFLCLWNSQDDSNHFSKVQWDLPEVLDAGRFNVKHVPLADPKNVLRPPIHIKLGLRKYFVRAMGQDSEFKYFKKNLNLTKVMLN